MTIDDRGAGHESGEALKRGLDLGKRFGRSDLGYQLMLARRFLQAGIELGNIAVSLRPEDQQGPDGRHHFDGSLD